MKNFHNVYEFPNIINVTATFGIYCDFCNASTMYKPVSEFLYGLQHVSRHNLNAPEAISDNVFREHVRLQINMFKL